MAARRTGDDSLINSIVGPGTFFRGHLELSGLLRIDGDFSGSVKTDGRVIVGQAGRADCAIEAATVVVGGLFRGEILAFEKVVLLASAVVIGTISTPRLVAENGVLLSGRFRVTGSVEDLVAPGDLAGRRKELLLESVRTRETAQSAGDDRRSSRVAENERTVDSVRDRAGASAQENLAIVRGGGGEWRG